MAFGRLLDPYPFLTYIEILPGLSIYCNCPNGFAFRVAQTNQQHCRRTQLGEIYAGGDGSRLAATFNVKRNIPKIGGSLRYFNFFAPMGTSVRTACRGCPSQVPLRKFLIFWPLGPPLAKAL